MPLKHTDNYYYDIVRRNIKKYRKAKGYTLEKLSEAAEMSMEYLSEIESLKRNKSFSLAILGRISDVLEIDIRDFFAPIEDLNNDTKKKN